VRISATLDFGQVLERFHAEHGVDKLHESNTNSDGEMHLLRADALLGRWAEVMIGREEIRNVVLPWHLSEDGAIALVPPSGRSVGRAVDELRPLVGRYAVQSPVCWRKLERMRTAPWTPVYLSTEAIDAPDYDELQVRRGLIHLDGLHRLVSWELHGLLTDATEVVAYVAGAG
jgi:uncharacterized protein DUF6309